MCNALSRFKRSTNVQQRPFLLIDVIKQAT